MDWSIFGKWVVIIVVYFLCLIKIIQDPRKNVHPLWEINLAGNILACFLVAALVVIFSDISNASNHLLFYLFCILILIPYFGLVKNQKRRESRESLPLKLNWLSNLIANLSMGLLAAYLTIIFTTDVSERSFWLWVTPGVGIILLFYYSHLRKKHP